MELISEGLVIVCNPIWFFPPAATAMPTFYSLFHLNIEKFMASIMPDYKFDIAANLITSSTLKK